MTGDDEADEYVLRDMGCMVTDARTLGKRLPACILDPQVDAVHMTHQLCRWAAERTALEEASYPTLGVFGSTLSLGGSCGGGATLSAGFSTGLLVHATGARAAITRRRTRQSAFFIAGFLG
jgi:hypothetical protein